MENVLEDVNAELFALMKSVGERLKAVEDGQPVEPFAPQQLLSLLLCVGESLFANHRVMLFQ
jgi:hypothetical protein